MSVVRRFTDSMQIKGGVCIWAEGGWDLLLSGYVGTLFSRNIGSLAPQGPKPLIRAGYANNNNSYFTET